MKLVKSLVLGSAATLLVVGGAQAADLPVKAKAVEYVRVCSLYGAGFWYIPGTDTCIKLGGYLRAELALNANTDATPAVSTSSGATGGAGNRFSNAYLWRSREDLSIDTRTATEYGVVRTFFDATFSWTTDNYNANAANAGTSVYAPLGGGGTVGPGSLPNNGSSGAVANGTVGVYYAFIQFAGFTMGKAVSEFSMPWENYPGNNIDGLVGGGGTVTGVSQFTYTAQFGNGVSAAISAQDQTQYYQAGVFNLSAQTLSVFAGASNYAGTVAPDIVANVTVDQAWGLFKASVAAHDNHVGYYGASELTGHPDDKWGFAAQAGFTIKNIPTGPGDTINASAVYTNGATRYNIQDLASGLGGVTMYGGTSLPGAYQSIAFGFAPDTVFTANGQQQLIQTWGMRGAFNHNWDPYWSTSLYGAFAAIRYNDTAKSLICGPGGTILTRFTTNLTNCNPDYNVGQVGVITRWTPVKNLTFSADVLYTMIDQNMAGTITTSGAAVAKPTAVYEFKDQSTVTVLLRAQRNW